MLLTELLTYNRRLLHTRKWRDVEKTETAYLHRRQRRRGCRGRDPQYLTCRSRTVLTTPPVCWQVFHFFPFSGTSEYRKSLSFSSIKFIIQLQSMGHMNLKNNTPRMHHIAPFWDEKFINFLGRGTAPSQNPTPRRLRRLDSSIFGARPATPNVPVALAPMLISARRLAVETVAVAAGRIV